MTQSTVTTKGKLSIAEAFDSLMREPLPLRITAYDGSTAGPEDAPYRFHIATERGLNYLMSSPDPDLGMGRAYVSGDLQLFGAHPGDPYEALAVLKDGIKFRRPSPTELVNLVRSATSDTAIHVDVDLSGLPFGGDFPFGGKRGNRRVTGWI